MTVSRQYFVSVALALATSVAMGGLVGCGGVGSSRNGGAGSRSGSGSAVMTKADVVDVTYYYLPG